LILHDLAFPERPAEQVKPVDVTMPLQQVGMDEPDKGGSDLRVRPPLLRGLVDEALKQGLQIFLKLERDRGPRAADFFACSFPHSENLDKAAAIALLDSAMARLARQYKFAPATSCE
jgi:hypothetical protein